MGGFIVARGVAHAFQGEWKAVPDLLDQLPMEAVSLAGDTGYNVGQLRELLEEQDIKAYVPIHPIQENNMVAKGGYAFRDDHLVCPQGNTLRRTTFHSKNLAYQYVGLQKDCQACPVMEDCLPPGQKRRYISLTMFYPLYLRARERNRTSEYQQERFRRRTIAEGTFASLDRLSWARSRLRGLWKVDCEGYMAALALNLLKMVRKLNHRVAPPDPAVSAAAESTESGSTGDDTVSSSSTQPQYRLRQSRLLKRARPLSQRLHCRRRWLFQHSLTSAAYTTPGQFNLAL